MLVIFVAVCRIRWIIVRKYRLINTQNEGDEEYFEVEQKQTMKDIRKIWMTVGYMLLLQVNALIFDCLAGRIEFNLAYITWYTVTNFSSYVMLWWPILYVFYPWGKPCKRKKKQDRVVHKRTKPIPDNEDP